VALNEEISSLAAQVKSRGMSIPAIFFLEMYKPLTSLLHVGSVICAPVMLPIFGANFSQRAAQFLESRENVELLIRELETLERGK